MEPKTPDLKTRAFVKCIEQILSGDNVNTFAQLRIEPFLHPHIIIYRIRNENLGGGKINTFCNAKKNDRNGLLVSSHWPELICLAAHGGLCVWRKSCSGERPREERETESERERERLKGKQSLTGLWVSELRVTELIYLEHVPLTNSARWSYFSPSGVTRCK